MTNTLLMQIEGLSFISVILITAAILFVFIILVVAIKRYKRCPSDRILVVYGKVSGGKSAKCIHGGAAFIYPVIQEYEFLDLTPMSIEVNLINALSKQNIRVNVPSRFTIGISTEPGIMQNAAERLLGLNMNDVKELAMEIIFGQLRLVVASMDIEEINSDRDKFLTNISQSVESELKKVGLKLINVNITVNLLQRKPEMDLLEKQTRYKMNVHRLLLQMRRLLMEKIQQKLKLQTQTP